MEKFQFDGRWMLEYCFEAFKGLQSRRGSYTSVSSKNTSDGCVSLTINDDISDQPDPYEEQVNAINFIIDNPLLIRNALRRGLDSIYEDLKFQYCYQEGDEYFETIFPLISRIDDYDDLFGVGNIYVQLAVKNGFAYVGIECGCSWDEEHGLGFLLHKDRVVSIGSADEAFNWKAYKDNGTFEEIVEEQKKVKTPQRFLPHPKYNQLKPSQELENKAYVSNLIRRGFNEVFIEEVEKGLIDINGSYELIDSTYLELAVSCKNLEIAEYLLKKGANIRGEAFRNSNLESVNLLLNFGGNINAKDKFGETIFLQKVKQLLSLYKSKNWSDKNNRSQSNEIDKKIIEVKVFLKELIKCGAKINSISFGQLHRLIDISSLSEDQQNELLILFDFKSPKKEDMVSLRRNTCSSKKLRNEARSKRWWQFWR